MSAHGLPTIALIGTALRHLRADSNRDPLDFRNAGSNPTNRWNLMDQPTLYLASDIGVLIAEWGRSFAPALGDIELVHREVYSYTLRINSVVSLLEESTREQLNLNHIADSGILDRNLSRSIATTVRHTTDAQAMLVPSVAFLDDPSRWNLVVFLEKMPVDTALWITDVNKIGPLRWK